MSQKRGDFMIRWIGIALSVALLTFTVTASAADIAANASRDVARLVNCMKAFDARCANSLTYTRVLEQHGISRSQLDQAVSGLYANLKSIHAIYSRLELSTPWPPFENTGRSYTFIPYYVVLEANGRKMMAKSFFIGVSEDSGVSWKFVDGQQITKDTISHVIPGYVGKLPEQEVNATTFVPK